MKKKDDYSCGSTPNNDGAFQTPFYQLSRKDRDVRVLFLWKKAFVYSKAANIIVRKMLYQNNKIFVDGYTNIRNTKSIRLFKKEDSDVEVNFDKQNDEEMLTKQKQASCLIFPNNSIK